jgi:predicted AlkP superfamily phosphohydrolase/phosphomutase
MDKKILFLGLDAAMPDLVKKFVAEGVMPNTAKLMNQGVFSRLETVFPPLTAAAWTAIVSGAGSGTNGVPSLMVKHPGEELDHWHTSFDRREVLCETLWDVAKDCLSTEGEIMEATGLTSGEIWPGQMLLIPRG